MNEQADKPGREPDDSNTIAPLPGEVGIPNVAERQRISISKKGLLAVGLLVLSLVVVAAFTIQRFSASGKKADNTESKLVSDRPTAATGEPRRLEIPLPAAAASAPAPAGPRIPAIVPTAEEAAEPIGVRRTGAGAPAGGNPKAVSPEDAPVLLVSTRPAPPGTTPAAQLRASDRSESASAERQEPDLNDPIANTARNLQGYQRQLQGLLDTLARSTALATGQATGQVPAGAVLGGSPAAATPLGGAPMSAPGAGLFGGQLQGSATPRVAASMLGNRSLTLPKGTAFTCALKTKVISAVSR